MYVSHPDGMYDTFTTDGSRFSNYYSHASTSEYIESSTDPRLGGVARFDISNITSNSGMSGGLYSRARSVAATSMFNFTQTDSFNYNGVSSTLVYSSANQTQTAISALGRQDSVQIDSLERPVLVTSRGYTPTAFTYNQQGFTTQITRGPRVWQMQYDTNGHLSKLTDAIGRVFNYSYDIAGRLLSQTTPDGRIQQFAYDANGNAIRLTPGNNFNFDFVLNALDLMTLFQPPSVVASGTLIGTPTQFVYNADKELTQVIRPDGSVINYNFGATDGRYYGASSGSESIGLAYYPATAGGGNAGVVGVSIGMNGENISYNHDTYNMRTYSGLFNYDFDLGPFFGPFETKVCEH